MNWVEAERRWEELCEFYEKTMEQEEHYMLMCPILHRIPLFPVRCSDGFVYEDSAVRKWITDGGNVSPMTRGEINLGEVDEERLDAIDAAAKRVTIPNRPPQCQMLRV